MIVGCARQVGLVWDQVTVSPTAIVSTAGFMDPLCALWKKKLSTTESSFIHGQSLRSALRRRFRS